MKIPIAIMLLLPAAMLAGQDQAEAGGHSALDALRRGRDVAPDGDSKQKGGTPGSLD